MWIAMLLNIGSIPFRNTRNNTDSYQGACTYRDGLSAACSLLFKYKCAVPTPLNMTLVFTKSTSHTHVDGGRRWLFTMEKRGI